MNALLIDLLNTLQSVKGGLVERRLFLINVQGRVVELVVVIRFILRLILMTVG